MLSCMHLLNAKCIVCCAALQPGTIQEKDDFGLPSSLDVEASPSGPAAPPPQRKMQVRGGGGGAAALLHKLWLDSICLAHLVVLLCAL